MRISLLVLAAATATATQALAEPRSATVIVSSADFSSPSARARLDHRIAAAVEQVCGSYATIEAYQTPEMDACWRAARSQVEARLGRVDNIALAKRDR